MCNEITENLYNLFEITYFKELFNELTFKVFEYDEYYN